MLWLNAYYLSINGWIKGIKVKVVNKPTLKNSVTVLKLLIHSVSCWNATKLTIGNPQRHITTNSRCRNVLKEMNLKMSLPFFSLTAIKLILCRSHMNLDADDWESFCINEFTFVFIRGMINKPYSCRNYAILQSY